MYEVGDLVIYGTQGVCRVENIGPLTIGKNQGDRLYYTLAPVYDNGRTYTPVDTEVYMRPIISYQEAEMLIEEIPNILYDTSGKNTKDITVYYKEKMNSHSCQDLIAIIRTVYVKNKKLQEQGKKLGQTDERFKREAEEVLHQELAMALNIPKDEVAKYIQDHVTEKQLI